MSWIKTCQYNTYSSLQTQKISFEKFEIKQNVWAYELVCHFLGQKCTAYELVRQYDLNILMVCWPLFGIFWS